jgi:hypothetical protein
MRKSLESDHVCWPGGSELVSNLLKQVTALHYWTQNVIDIMQVTRSFVGDGIIPQYYFISLLNYTYYHLHLDANASYVAIKD